MDLQLIRSYYNDWQLMLPTFQKMYNYYCGKTDIETNYKLQTDRSNLKTKCNFLKKYIDEEVSYSLGNDITYISKSGDIKITNSIDYNFESLSEQHDNKLLKTLLIFNKAFELKYLEDNEFKCKVLSPLECFKVKDSLDNTVAYCRVWKRTEEVNGVLKDINYIDVYTNNMIYHYKGEFTEIAAPTPHYFGDIPIKDCSVGDEGIYNTLYNTIKGLQDAYETNLSDLTNEIADFRNAYLILTGTEIEEETAKNMKKLGIMQLGENGKAEWLIKNLNDTFIQNTLNTLEDKMYQLSQHINHNEAMQSNVSGIALRSRLISLEEKCKLNQRALTDCIKARLKALFIHLNTLSGTKFDWRDIKIKFTPNIPQDDVGMADIISKLNGILSKETALAQLSFIENPSNEVEKVKKEQEQAFPSLDNLGGGNIE